MKLFHSRPVIIIHWPSWTFVFFLANLSDTKVFAHDLQLAHFMSKIYQHKLQYKSQFGTFQCSTMPRRTKICKCSLTNGPKMHNIALIYGPHKALHGQWNWDIYAVKAQTSLAPLSRFCGSRITTAHEQQCCRFQSYAKTSAIANEIDKRNWQSVNHIPGIHDNGPHDHSLWRLTLTAYCDSTTTSMINMIITKFAFFYS